VSKRTVLVEIMGQEYRIRSESDASTIHRAAALVDEIMAKVRDRTGVVNTLDIAVLTALNIANHLIPLRDSTGDTSQGVEIRSSQLGELIDLVEAAIAETAPTTH
jgi:cell division protein ZapA (FtsZ GTPase activity inhibitor)